MGCTAWLGGRCSGDLDDPYKDGQRRDGRRRQRSEDRRPAVRITASTASASAARDHVPRWPSRSNNETGDVAPAYRERLPTKAESSCPEKPRTSSVLSLLRSASSASSESPAPRAAEPTTHVGPGESIQAAVDAADPGDTIRVTGRHHENVVVQTDGLTLLGHGAVILPPATPAAHACYDPTVVDEAVHGICLWGDIDVDTGEITNYVEGVTVAGFRIRGFAGTGLVAVAAKSTKFAGNTLRNNLDAGINTTNSLDTRIWGNRSSATSSAFSARWRKAPASPRTRSGAIASALPCWARPTPGSG